MALGGAPGTPGYPWVHWRGGAWPRAPAAPQVSPRQQKCVGRRGCARRHRLPWRTHFPAHIAAWEVDLARQDAHILCLRGAAGRRHRDVVHPWAGALRPAWHTSGGCRDAVQFTPRPAAQGAGSPTQSDSSRSTSQAWDRGDEASPRLSRAQRLLPHGIGRTHLGSIEPQRSVSNKRSRAVRYPDALRAPAPAAEAGREGAGRPGSPGSPWSPGSGASRTAPQGGQARTADARILQERSGAESRRGATPLRPAQHARVQPVHMRRRGRQPDDESGHLRQPDLPQAKTVRHGRLCRHTHAQQLPGHGERHPASRRHRRTTHMARGRPAPAWRPDGARGKRPAASC